MISLDSNSPDQARQVPGRPPAETTVALVDCRWYGHHPTYFRAMSRALLKAGYRVVAICPAPDECAQFVREDFSDDAGPAGRFHAVLFRDPPTVILPSRLDHDPVSTRRRWKELTRSLADAEEGSGWRIDCLFFAWLDSFLRFGSCESGPERLAIPWSGLYFRNHHLLRPGSFGERAIRLLKGDGLLGDDGCHSIGLLDDRPADRLTGLYGVKPVLFPDITNGFLPEQPTGRAKALRDQAGDRFVLGMISLEPRKGVMEMLRVADAARDQPWFWVFTGPYEEDWFTGRDRELIHRLKGEADRGEVDHLHLDLSGDRIPDGAEYNSVFCAFDAVLAVYPGWEASSNALTKAALFEKPVLAWDGGCVGQRVRDFRLGLTVDPNDVNGIIEAIGCLERGVDRDGQPLEPEFAAYRELHSLDQLQRSLVEVVENAQAVAGRA